MPGGRPPHFKTPESLWEAFESYKASLTEDEIADVEGFCNHIDSYRDLLSEYEKKEEFSSTIKRIKNWIYYRKKQLAMKGKMNAAIFIFDAKNNFGYVDKQEIDQNISGELKTGESNSELAKGFAEYLKDETRS